MTESVKVMVRCRPMSQKEIQRDCKNIIVVDKLTHQVGMKKISTVNASIKQFAYDYVFGEDSSQQEVYEQSSFSLVENVLNGYNGTIFAYGQTGCGKTYTMLGVTTTLSTKKAQMISNNKQNLPVTVTSLKLQEQTIGIVPRAFRQIMTITNSQTNKNHLIQCTFIQIYNEEIHDLLGKDIREKIHLQETPDGLIMKDLSVHLVKNVAEMDKYMEIGYKNRVIRETSMNKESSRSHCIFTIRIEESQYDDNGVQKFKVGKLNLVDLAGSERQSKTNLKDEGIKQAAKINLSLSALGNVISALVDGKKDHVPYRDSKLTRILSDSLGGNTKTVMIATISPADYNYEETLSTLRYSSRAKFIKNKPIINEDPKDALLRKYEEQIRRLKLILEGKLPYVRGNETFYIGNQKNQMNLFKKFPELQTQQNQAILDRMSEINHNLDDFLKSQEAERPKDLSEINENSAQIQENAKKADKQIQQLRNQLKFLQEIVKKQINTSPEVLEELNKISELKQKLKEQAQKQQKYKEQQKLREQELMNIQKNYKNLNEQVDSIKLKYQQLLTKYVQTVEQLKDARHAHELEKQEVLDALRIQEAENNKLMEILNVVLPDQQLEKIFNNCQWLDNTKQWVVPKFTYSQKSGISISKFGVDKQRNSKILERNLLLQQAHQQKGKYKQHQSQKKFSQSINSSAGQRKAKHERMLSRHEQARGLNLFKPIGKKNSFKNSSYSDSAKPSQSLQNEASSNQSKRMLDKNKFSLQPLPKIKSTIEKSQIKVSLNLEQIKRQVMNEILQKNKLGLPSKRH